MLSSLSDVQAAFAAALRDPEAPVPAGVTGPDGGAARRRFAVYRNNVLVALGNAIAGSFPAVGRLVGEDFFKAMVRAYVLATPPTSPVLIAYGATFPDFIASFPPAASLPYLADVARIERAWREAYHAAEATPLGPEAFAGIPEAELVDATVRLHPSTRLMPSRFPAITIWRMNVSETPPGPVDFSVGEDALIVRPDAEVEVRVAPPGGLAFAGALAAGGTLGAAAEAGLAADPRFDLAGNIAGLIRAGALVEIRRGSTRD